MPWAMAARVFMLHGTTDTTVPVTATLRMYEALIEAEVAQMTDWVAQQIAAQSTDYSEQEGGSLCL